MTNSALGDTLIILAVIGIFVIAGLIVTSRSPVVQNAEDLEAIKRDYKLLQDKYEQDIRPKTQVWATKGDGKYVTATFYIDPEEKELTIETRYSNGAHWDYYKEDQWFKTREAAVEHAKKYKADKLAEIQSYDPEKAVPQ